MINNGRLVSIGRRAGTVITTVILMLCCGCSSGGRMSAVDDSAEPGALKRFGNSGNITIYSFDSGSAGVSPPADYWYNDFLAYFNDKYGGTVSTVQVEWQNWEDRFLIDFASGTAPDLIHLYENNFPTLIRSKAVMPVSELEAKGIVGLDHPLLMNGRELVSRIYSYNGECYSFADYMAEADMIFVNEDLFDLYGVTSPSYYYVRGLWSQSTFEQCAREISRDLNGDGYNDIFGFYCRDPYSFIAASGGELISLCSDGSYKVCLDDPATVTGLKNFNRMYGIQKTGTFTSTWYLGKTAMIASSPYKESVNLKNRSLDFKWSMIPFPLDSGNTDSKRSGRCYGWAVTSSSYNPQGCINYVIAYNAYSILKPDASLPGYSGYFDQSQLLMLVDCADNISVPTYCGVGESSELQWQMWEALSTDPCDIERVIGSYTERFEKQTEAMTGQIRS